MLKTDLHIHTSEDQYDHYIRYDAKAMIRAMAKKGFEVLSVTNHNNIYFNKEIKDYAKKKGVLLIPGVELTLEESHVLVHNVTNEDVKNVRKIKDLWKIKSPEILITAPHPFFPGKRAMKEKLLENINLFDAIEYSHFYFNMINFNKKAVKVASRFEKPLIGTSDAHFLMQTGYTYSLIDGEKSVQGVIDAIRKQKVKVVTKPFPKMKIGFVLGTIMTSSVLRKLKIKI